MLYSLLVIGFLALTNSSGSGCQAAATKNIDVIVKDGIELSLSTESSIAKIPLDCYTYHPYDGALYADCSSYLNVDLDIVPFGIKISDGFLNVVAFEPSEDVYCAGDSNDYVNTLSLTVGNELSQNDFVTYEKLFLTAPKKKVFKAPISPPFPAGDILQFPEKKESGIDLYTNSTYYLDNYRASSHEGEYDANGLLADDSIVQIIPKQFFIGYEAWNSVKYSGYLGEKYGFYVISNRTSYGWLAEVEIFRFDINLPLINDGPISIGLCSSLYQMYHVIEDPLFSSDLPASLWHVSKTVCPVIQPASIDRVPYSGFHRPCDISLGATIKRTEGKMQWDEGYSYDEDRADFFIGGYLPEDEGLNLKPVDISGPSWGSALSLSCFLLGKAFPEMGPFFDLASIGCSLILDGASLSASNGYFRQAVSSKELEGQGIELIQEDSLTVSWMIKKQDTCRKACDGGPLRTSILSLYSLSADGSIKDSFSLKAGGSVSHVINVFNKRLDGDISERMECFAHYQFNVVDRYGNRVLSLARRQEEPYSYIKNVIYDVDPTILTDSFYQKVKRNILLQFQAGSMPTHLFDCSASSSYRTTIYLFREKQSVLLRKTGSFYHLDVKYQSGDTLLFYVENIDSASTFYSLSLWHPGGIVS